MSYKEFEQIFLEIIKTKELLKYLPSKYDERLRNAQMNLDREQKAVYDLRVYRKPVDPAELGRLQGVVDGILAERQQEFELLQQSLAKLQNSAMSTEFYQNGKRAELITGLPSDYSRGLL